MEENMDFISLVKDVAPVKEASQTDALIDPDKRVDVTANEPFYGFDRSAEIDPDARIPFKGFSEVEPIANLQEGGTCASEAMENICQIMNGDVAGRNNGVITNKIQNTLRANPKEWDARTTSDGKFLTFPKEKYCSMLKTLGVNAEQTAFSHSALQKALENHKPVLLSGDAKRLSVVKPEYIGPSEGHAVVAVDWDPGKKEYTILDSNFPRTYKVPADTLHSFVACAPEWMVRAFGSKLPSIFPSTKGSMIVPTTSAAWPRGTGGANGEKWLGSFKGIAKDSVDSKFEHGRIDLESLKKIQGLDFETWGKASFEQRCSALKELANKIADQTGIPRAKVVFKDMGDIHSCGAYYDKTNTLTINSLHLKQGANPRFRSECIDTVAHEMRHAYQHYAVKNPGFHPNSREVAYWAENIPHYITPEMAIKTWTFPIFFVGYTAK